MKLKAKKAMKPLRGGVPVPHEKATAGLAAVRMPAPERVALAMRQHIGAEASPVVKVGDSVAVGQLVGDSEGFVCAPVHASVSGRVTEIKELTLPNGEKTQAVVIESDGEMRLFEGISPPVFNNKKEFLAAVRASGLVGLGGAGFPTHVKLSWPDTATVDTLIVNAAECEPYITVDCRECIDNTHDVLDGAAAIKEIFGIPRVVIAVEDDKPEAVSALARVAGGVAVEIITLKSRYPQGAEKMLVRSVTGRKIPPGKLPFDVGCVVMNAASVAFIARYLKTGKPLLSRSLTIAGPAVAEPKNVRVPIGTGIGDIIAFCGGFCKEPALVLMGGPMMGLAVANTDMPTLKQTGAILAFDREAAQSKREGDCIRCGRCARVCPLSLTPTLIMKLAKAKDAERLRRIGADVCMECGSCAYSCPAGIPLVQYMRLAKAVIDEGGEQS